MSNATANTRKQRRRWSAADKALIVRRYLRDNVALADWQGRDESFFGLN